MARKEKRPQEHVSDNPLLGLSPLPNHAPRFDLIREEHYLPAITEAIARARQNIEAIKRNPAPANFENTIVTLEAASEDLGSAAAIFYNLLSAAGTDGLHKLAQEIGPLNANFSNDVMLDSELFARVKAVYDTARRDSLSAEQITLLEETYKDFVRSGALLDEKKKERLREISQRLSVLGPNFINNVSKSSESFSMIIEDEKDLSGLPESARIGSLSAAQEKGLDGKWLFTLDYPSYGPFMQYADNRALREKMWRAFNSRAFGGQNDNCGNVLETIRLRHERAQLLGYKSHAHFVLEQRMAETPENVMAFLEKLKSAYKPGALDDLAMLQDFARRQNGPEKLQPWDIGYYSEKLKQSLFRYSSEDLRPYFPLQTVLDGCFAHFSKLFNLDFKENNSYPKWHKDVTVYDVTDKDRGQFVGTFYADFFPRKGKKDGAWKSSYRTQGLFHGKNAQSLVSIVCNFTKPAKDRPSLLTYEEVLTLFHEMGHAVHALLSRVTYSSLGGTHVKWDFVELPSQVQENWVYQKETLDMVSGHYKTGDKIPDELVEKINAAKNFMVGWTGLRQIGAGILDMSWHTADPASITDVAAFEDKATAGTALFPRMAGPVSASFSHIFAGAYSAGYYGYKWAEVLDSDTFELFLEKGLYDRKTADAYKNEILSKGGSEHPRILYRRFRGRDADPDALLRREGLLKKSA